MCQVQGRRHRIPYPGCLRYIREEVVRVAATVLLTPFCLVRSEMLGEVGDET